MLGERAKVKMPVWLKLISFILNLNPNTLNQTGLVTFAQLLYWFTSSIQGQAPEVGLASPRVWQETSEQASPS